MKTTPLIAALLLSLGASASFAQTAASTVQRDVNQETRIEQGLKSGQLNTREASRLEREESKVDRLQTQALKDGKLSPAEQSRLKAAQVPRLQGEIADLWASLAAVWVTCLRVARERDRAQADLDALLEVTLG